jgi:hypothetical protein
MVYPPESYEKNSLAKFAKKENDRTTENTESTEKKI